MAENYPTVTFYCGKPIAELTREELIEALENVGKELLHSYEQARHDRKLYSEMLDASTKKRNIFLEFLKDLVYD